MKPPLTLDVSVSGLAETAAGLQRLRNAVANRGPLHAHLAVFGAEKLRENVAKLERHKTANRLGAKPTNHLQRTAVRIEGQSDDSTAQLLIPRASRLRAAFGEYTVRPGSGKTYVTIPDHIATYGKRAPEFPPKTFRFVPFGGPQGRFKALVFADGPYKGQVGYWLRTETLIPEDETLIPFKLLLAELADETIDYLDEVANGEGDLV